HQTLFFSATITDEIKKLAYSQVKSEAIRIQVSPKDPVSKNVSHAVMFVGMDDKRFFLADFLQSHEQSKVIVFVRTKVRAERVVKAMARVGITCQNIHGDKEQQQRAQVMQAFRNGDCRVLIATDVSARGIDVPDIEYVINYDLPDKAENYVHRVGRTGRGVNKGQAIAYCAEEERPLLEAIQDFINKPIQTIQVGKNTYNDIASAPEKSNQDLKSLVAEHDAWLQGKGKRSKKRKK
ncbi:MAG: DEAD/DEAH box helicase, partial [Mariprofundaceae bacterium]|nr:DEAD/DEAH box helicase [Mariprofundaceae bacterium]